MRLDCLNVFLAFDALYISTAATKIAKHFAQKLARSNNLQAHNGF